MSGRFKYVCESDSALAADASASFQVLLDALASLRNGGSMPDGYGQELALFIWATVHGWRCYARLATCR
jgi:hypothetical protein